MPDGVDVRFPDDMPPDQIRSLILQKYPDAAETAKRPPKPPNAAMTPEEALALAKARALALAAARQRAAAQAPAVGKGGLPPGFVLDAPQGASGLPPGFVLDQPGDPSTRLSPQPVQTINDPAAKTSDFADVLNSAGSGLVTGVHGLGGFLGDVQGMTRDAGTWIGDKFGLKPLPPDSPLVTGGPLAPPTTSDLMSATGFHPYQPKTTAGEFANTIGSFAPAALLGGGKSVADVAKTLLRLGIVPAVASEGAGQLARKVAPGNATTETVARVAAALLGPMALSGVERAITPLPAAAERTAAVSTLSGEGVTDLTAGQTTGSNALRYFESENGGGKAADMMTAQGEQFTQAALQRIGEKAPRATPEVMNRAFTRIGGEFDRLSANNTMTADPTLASDINQTLKDYTGQFGPGAAPSVVMSYAKEIGDGIKANSPVTK